MGTGKDAKQRGDEGYGPWLTKRLQLGLSRMRTKGNCLVWSFGGAESPDADSFRQYYRKQYIDDDLHYLLPVLSVDGSPEIPSGAGEFANCLEKLYLPSDGPQVLDTSTGGNAQASGSTGSSRSSKSSSSGKAKESYSRSADRPSSVYLDEMGEILLKSVTTLLRGIEKVSEWLLGSSLKEEVAILPHVVHFPHTPQLGS